MKNFDIAVNYLKQLLDFLVDERVRLKQEEDQLQIKKAQLTKDVEALAALKSSFLLQTKAQTAENEKAKKLFELAKKMKTETDNK